MVYEREFTTMEDKKHLEIRSGEYNLNQTESLDQLSGVHCSSFPQTFTYLQHLEDNTHVLL